MKGMLVGLVILFCTSLSYAGINGRIVEESLQVVDPEFGYVYRGDQYLVTRSASLTASASGCMVIDQSSNTVTTDLYMTSFIVSSGSGALRVQVFSSPTIVTSSGTAVVEDNMNTIYTTSNTANAVTYHTPVAVSAQGTEILDIYVPAHAVYPIIGGYTQSPLVLVDGTCFLVAITDLSGNANKYSIRYEFFEK